MRFSSLRLLADENIHPEVVNFLVGAGFDVLDIRVRQSGTSDSEILVQCCEENRVVLTHDADFGRLAMLQGQRVTGIVFLRPGHIDPVFTIETIQVLAAQAITLEFPFILVARRQGNQVKIRLRRW